MAKIFLSYRREDSAGHAGRLFDRLSQHFGPDNVFMDVDTIRPGEDFARIIDARIAQCDVMLALIGKDWVSLSTAERGRRLDDPEDFVRLEILAALNRGLIVIPVLVNDAKMPSPSELPSALVRLTRLQAISLSNTRFSQETENLIDSIENCVQSPIPSASVIRPRRRPWGALAAAMLGLGVLLGLLWANNPGFLHHSPAQRKDISGQWVAQVPTANGKSYKLALDLELSNDKILGRVQFPMGAGAVTQGRVERDQLSFTTVHQPQFSERQVTTRFEGKVVGDELELVMQYDDVLARIRARRGK